MDRVSSQATVHGVTKNQKRLKCLSTTQHVVGRGTGWLVWAVLDPTHRWKFFTPFSHLGPLFIWPKILNSFEWPDLLAVVSPVQPPREAQSFPSAKVSWHSDVTFLLDLQNLALLINERKPGGGLTLGALASSYLRGGNLGLWGHVPTLWM